MGKAQLVEDFIKAGGVQGHVPLAPQQFRDVRRGPLIAVDAIVGRDLMQQDVAQDFAALGCQRLRAGPFLRREQGVEASVEVAVQPDFEGFALDSLGPAHLGHARPVPDCLERHKPTAPTLLLVAVIQRLPKVAILGGQALNTDRAVHHTLLDEIDSCLSPH